MNNELYEKALKYAKNNKLNKSDYSEKDFEEKEYKNLLSYKLYEAMNNTKSIYFTLSQIKNIIDENYNYKMSIESENILFKIINKIKDFTEIELKKIKDNDYTNKK